MKASITPIKKDVLSFPGFSQVFSYTASGGETSVSATVSSDTDKEYVIFIMNKTAGENILVTLNADASTAYGYQMLVNEDGTVDAHTGSATYMGSHSSPGVLTAHLSCPTGLRKIWSAHMMQIGTASATTVSQNRDVINDYNSYDNITSINFISVNMPAGSRIVVFSRRSAA